MSLIAPLIKKVENGQDFAQREPEPRSRRRSSAVSQNVETWGKFSANYQKIDATCWNVEGTGYLQQSCTVRAYDYGQHENVNRCQIDGVDFGDASHELQRVRRTVSSVRQLLETFPSKFFEERPAWSSVRWINVEGMNGDIIQFLLQQVGCHRQYTFNNIVNLKQRAMALLLEDAADDGDNHFTKFLLVFKVGTLSDEASRRRDDASDVPHDPAPLVSFEQMAFVLRLEGGNGGTLLTIQEGNPGDPFDELRAELASPADSRLCGRGVGYLLRHLVEASTQSGEAVEGHLRDCLSRLRERVARNPTSFALYWRVQELRGECEAMRRAAEPLQDTLVQWTSGHFPRELMGRGHGAWHSLMVQQKRLVENLKEQEAVANQLLSAHRDRTARIEAARRFRADRNQRIMSVVLSMFAPLGFLSGIYGMNFQRPDGKPGLPELTWGYGDPDALVTGYGFFWIVVGVLSLVLVTTYMFLGLIPSPRDMWLGVTRRREEEEELLEEHTG